MKSQTPLDRYPDGLDILQIEKINSLQEPWQRNFVKRFYEKTYELNISDKEICERVNNNLPDLVDKGYRLNQSTLSQYTNFESKNIRPLSVTPLICIATTLDVSIDYLLGIETREKHNETDIFNETGLSNKSVEILSKSPSTKEFINAILQFENLDTLLQQIDNIFYSEYISKDILSAYSKDLRDILIQSFTEYKTNSLPIERNSNSFKKYFISKMSTDGIIIDKDYIISNVSADRFNQITILCNINNIDIVDAFYTDTIECVYDILSYVVNTDYYKGVLSETINRFISDLIIQRKNNLSVNLRDYAAHSK